MKIISTMKTTISVNTVHSKITRGVTPIMSTLPSVTVVKCLTHFDLGMALILRIFA